MENKPKIYLSMDKDSSIAIALLECVAKYHRNTQGMNEVTVEFVPKELVRSNHLDVLIQDYRALELYREKARKYDSLENAVKRVKEVWEK